MTKSAVNDQTEFRFLSVVVPARNEAANLPQLIDEIVAALRPLCDSGTHGLSAFEVVVVDDASTDETHPCSWDLSDIYPELRWLSLAATVGQSCAIAVGIRAARGTWIATLDADLQNDPADLVQLWRALPGYDAALGWRTDSARCMSRSDLSATGRTGFVMRCLGQAIRDTGCSVRIFSRDMALRLPMFHGMHRFIGPLLLREGCNLIQVPVESSAPAERLLALQSLESISLRDRRPSRCHLADAQAGAISSASRRWQPPEMIAPSTSEDTVSARILA